MPRARRLLAATELRPSAFPAFRDAILAAEQAPHATRAYPGYPSVPLPKPRRRLATFDGVVRARRSHWRLADAQLEPSALARVLALGHGLTGPEGRGPSPSAGNLQPIEVYLWPLAPGWLAPGAYHYDRAAHRLARVAEGATRAELAPAVPSLGQIEGGGALLVLAADVDRVERKYADRAARFALLEGGHVLGALGLAATSAGVSLVPIGGYFEAALADRLALPEGDAIVHAGVLGRPA